MMLEAAPLFDETADAPSGGVAYWLTTSDNVRIRIGHWTPPNAKGTVFLFPGRTEYIEKYGRAATDLYQRGYATISVDWRGQGIADRLLEDPLVGHVEEFTDYQKDVAAVLDAAQELNLPRPYFLLAHSMGGCIGLRALIEGLPVEAAVFSGPMWGIRISPLARPIAWALTLGGDLTGQSHRLPPGSSIEPYVGSAPFENNMLTRDPEMYDYMVRQLDQQPEFSLGGPSLRWLGEALRETRNLAAMASPAVPCLSYVGSNERIVDPARIEQRMKDWPCGQLETVMNAEHEVLMENPEIRNHVFEAATTFFAMHNHENNGACSA